MNYCTRYIVNCIVIQKYKKQCFIVRIEAIKNRLLKIIFQIAGFF